MKNFIFFLIILTIITGITAQTAELPLGNGTVTNPYQITTWQNLYWMTQNSNQWDKQYVQTADITLPEDINTWDNGQGWTPVGTDYHGFTGTYDGQSHIISGLFISRPTTDIVGMFGKVGNLTNSSTICNLRLINLNITGHDYVGGLLGYKNPLGLFNCSVMGSVAGNESVGGLVGWSYGSVTQCYSEGSVSGFLYTGGLIGQVFNGEITNCYNTCDVTGDSITGGLIGFGNTTITSCYNTGSVCGGSVVGGLCGTGGCYINNCYNTASVTGYNTVGGIVAVTYSGEINDSYNLGSVTSITDNPGGLIGKMTDSPIHNSFYNYNTVLLNEAHRITLGALSNDQFNQWLTNNQTLDINSYFAIDTSNRCIIYNNNDLKNVLGFVQFEGHDFILANNLDLSNEPNFYFPYFMGSFNGNSKTISNINISSPTQNYLGFFSYASQATISNLGLTNINISGANFVGGLVGYNCENVTINNCYCYGNVSGVSEVGGLVGYNSINTNIYNCHISGEIAGSLYTGGLVGHNLGTINSSYSIGSVLGNECTGGFIGLNEECNINNCFNRASVSGISIAGGLYGKNIGSSTYNCYSTGTVTADNNNGGYVGYNDSAFMFYIFWDIQTSGLVGGYGAINIGYIYHVSGRTTAEMKTQSTFTDEGWDFSNVWYISPEVNDGYPSLYNIVSEDDPVIPEPATSEAILYNAYPNPFNPTTKISFELAIPGKVCLEIFNVKGQKVCTLMQENCSAGKHSIVWNGKDASQNTCSSGVYFYKMQAGKYKQTRKMMLLK